MAPAIAKGYDPETPNRLEQLEWGSTLHNFVLSTVLSGRPVSISYWPQPMPTWAQLAGGPLRSDEVENVTNYVLNWGRTEWTVENLLAVEQFAKIPSEGATGIADPVAPDVINMQMDDIEPNRDMIDTTVTAVMGELESLTGDPNNGQALYNGALGCAACHSNASVAPPLDGTFTRVENVRLADPALAGYDVHHYLVESILVPNAYVVSGYAAGAMPQNVGERLTVQDLADIVAYLESQDGADPLSE
jgi:mono/diheme cytochrome c family protein